MGVTRVLTCAMSAFYLFSAGAVAGISLDSTRIIFPEAGSRQGQSIGIISSPDSPAPYLVKAQVLMNISDASTASPFSVTPSIFRLEQGTTNRVRILKTGREPLARDRESLFYFRTLSIPAGKRGENLSTYRLEGAVTVSTGNVIKLFYRPTGLATTPQQAMSALRFTRQDGTLRVSNASPYFVTLNALAVGENAVALSLTQQTTMIPPFGTMNYVSSGTARKVTWQTINDDGGVETFHGAIQ